MRAFTCKRCRDQVEFESASCRACGALFGFDPFSGNLEALEPDDGLLRPLGATTGRRWAYCQRSGLTGCNWLVPSADAGEPCFSCRLTNNLPPSEDLEYRNAFAKAETAKRRLIYQLLQLELPLVGKREDPETGLSFQLLASDRRVVTGHIGGLITLDLNETDDSFREQTRAQFGEPYRTLLGHFRHEIGHYYWMLLVERSSPRGPAGPVLEKARALFGDERADYNVARQRHYAQGPTADWGKRYVSAYAAMHPREDWAETFAHYLHIWDVVQTAASFGVFVGGPVDDRTGRRDPAKASVPSEDTASLEGFDAVILDWVPLAHALNALNRSLGKEDMYPFELQPPVVAKLALVHEVISAAKVPGR